MAHILEAVGSYRNLAAMANQEPVNGTVFLSPRYRAPILITHRVEGRPVSDRVARGGHNLRDRVLEVTHRHPGIVTSCIPFPSGKRGLNIELTRYYKGGVALCSYLQQQNGMSPRQLMRIMTPAVCGIAHLHANGLVHRDIKPSNILVVPSQDGHASAILADLETTTGFGRTPDIVRTQSYAPPEAFPPRGRWQPIHPAIDVFCLGVTLAEMLVYCTGLGGKPKTHDSSTQRKGGVDVSEGMLSSHMREALSTSHARYAERLLDVLDRAISPDPTTRPDIMTFWRELWRVFVAQSPLAPSGC